MRKFLDFVLGARLNAGTLPPGPPAAPGGGPPGEFSDEQYSLARGELVAGRYRILNIIGRGGMGEVYEARDELLQETVALKTLRVDAQKENIVRHFQREVQLARKVTHPNVCRLFETGVREGSGGAPDLPFFTMELLEGETLSTRIRRTGGLPRQEAFRIAVQMAEGLEAAHEAGIVHADFKSGNVLLALGRRGERAVITDFGLARIDPSWVPPDETRTIATEGQPAGTMAYMSPEQMTGGTVTAASDIYSFGIVLFEMATGKLPFDLRNPMRGVVQRVSGEGSAARAALKLDTHWQTGIDRCLEPEPARRFASAGDLADWFREARWHMPARHWTRRELARAIAVGAAALACMSGLWLWTHQPYRPQPAALAWYQKGAAAMHSMTYEAARRAFEQAVAADTEFAVARAGLAQSYEELDYSDQAKESMLRAAALAQETRLDGRDALRVRALQYLVARDYERAAPLFQRLEQEAGPQEKAAAALESGWLAQRRDDTEGAAAAYERALKIDPGYAAAKLRLGSILGRRREVEEALAAFREAEKLYAAGSNYEGVTEALLQQASLLNRSSRSKEAMPVIDRALGIAATVENPYQQIRLRLLQGVAFRYLGDSTRAVEIARQTIEAATAARMDNLAATGLMDLGNSYLFAGDPASAEPAFRKALDLATRGRVGAGKARAQISLASLCEQQHRPREAIEFIQASLPFYRQAGYRLEFVNSMTLLGSVQTQLAQFREGSRTLQEALGAVLQLQDSRSESLIRQRLGLALRNQGSWPQALGEFEREKGAWALGYSAELYWLLGRGSEAEQAFQQLEKLLEKSPNRQVLFDLRIHEARMAYGEGRLKDASVLARRVAIDSPSGEEDTQTARLVEWLVATHAQTGSTEAASGSEIVNWFEKAGLPGEAAAARLDVAQALLLAVRSAKEAKASAGKLASEALSFYEPRDIWESVWRAHWIAARSAADPAQAEAHRAQARAALGRLRTLWPPGTVEQYLQRPDLRLLVVHERL
jgi:tetratricopeptide (TPR) repeat protein